jgi:hypothetical protein
LGGRLPTVYVRLTVSRESEIGESRILGNVYRKLDVRNRTELTRALLSASEYPMFSTPHWAGKDPAPLA